MMPRADVDKPAPTFGWPRSPIKLFGITAAFFLVVGIIFMVSGLFNAQMPVLRNGTVTRVSAGYLWLPVALPFAAFALIYAWLELALQRVFDESATRVHFVCTLFAVMEAIRVYFSWATTTTVSMSPGELTSRNFSGVIAFLLLSLGAFIWNLLTSSARQAVPLGAPGSQGGIMSQAQDPVSGSTLRWMVFAGAAVVIAGGIAGSLWLHSFSSSSSGHSVAHLAAGSSSQAIPVKWEFTASGPISASLALADDGTVYAATEDGFLYAVDASGNQKWKFNAGPMLVSPVLGADGTIYVTNEDQLTSAVSQAGAERWANGGGPYAAKDMGAINAAIDQTQLYTPWRGPLRAMRLTDGRFDWPTGYGFQHGGSVAMLPDGVVVYSGVGRLDAADSTGRTQWEYPVMNPPVTVDMITKTGGHIPSGNFWLDSPMAIADDSTIYVCVADSRLVAINGADGRLKWEFKTKAHSVNNASPVIAGDATIYFASGDGTLYALLPDGTQKWALDLGGGAISAAPILAEDETIYVVTSTALVAVSPEGKLLARSSAGAGGDSSPTLDSDGTIYVATRTGKITAFSGTHGGLLSSAWPKFQAGPANSGRARSF